MTRAHLILFALITTGWSLSCLQTQADGSVKAEERAEWRYCSLQPLGNGLIHHSGMSSQSDDIRPHKAFYKDSVHGYAVSMVCFQESLDFGVLGARFEGHVERSTRCSCKGENCNSRQALYDFKSTLL